MGAGPEKTAGGGMPAGGEEDALACNRPAARAAPPQRPAPLPPDRRPVPMRPARPPPQPPQPPELPQAPVLGWQDARSIELQFPESPPANEDDISDEENEQLEALRAEMAALDEDGGEGFAQGQEEEREPEEPAEAEEGDDGERAEIPALELEQAVDNDAGDSEAEDDDRAIAALQSEVAELERGLGSDSDDSDEDDITALEAGARSSLCDLCKHFAQCAGNGAEVAALEADVAADERPSRTPPRLVSRTPPRPRSDPATLARKLPEPEPEPEPLSSFRPRRRAIQRESEPADEAEAPTLTMGFAPASDSVGVPPGYSRVLARPSLSALQRVDLAGARRARELAADIDSLVRT